MSIITIANLTQEDRVIKVNDEFVTLNLEYLRTKSTINGKKPVSRTDLIKKFASDDEWREISPLAEMSEEDLKEKMKKSPEYNIISTQKLFDKATIWLKTNFLTQLLFPIFTGLVAGLFVYYLTK